MQCYDTRQGLGVAGRLTSGIQDRGQHGRHAQTFRRSRKVDKADKARMTQGWAKNEEKSKANNAFYAGVDVTKNVLDVAVCDFSEVRRFANDDEGVRQAIVYVAELSLARIIPEGTLILAKQVTSPGRLQLWLRQMPSMPGYSPFSESESNRA